MADDRPWWREPETFVAVAALIVSISAVAVGLYEASLQRRHDRAEVWPRLELTTYTTLNGASLSIENHGIGPALIKSVTVTVDGKRVRSWNDVLVALLGHPPAAQFSNSTIAESALRPGDKVMMVGLPNADMPPRFWTAIHRVGFSVCYSSVFDEYWTLTDTALGGGRSIWKTVRQCPPQLFGEEF